MGILRHKFCTLGESDTVIACWHTLEIFNGWTIISVADKLWDLMHNRWMIACYSFQFSGTNKRKFRVVIVTFRAFPTP